MSIPIGQVGEISQGDQLGWQVKIINDKSNTGGYLICTSSDFSDLNAERFDDWVADLEALRGYLEESGWTIQWK